MKLNSKTLQKLQRVNGYKHPTHAILTSKIHSDTYLNKDNIVASPALVSDICQQIAQQIEANVDVVVGPSTGGYALAQFLAFWLTKPDKNDVLALPLVKTPNGLSIKRGQKQLLQGKKAILIDDVLKSGKTLQEARAVLQQSDVAVEQVIVLCNWRGQAKGVEEVLPRPYLASAQDCMLCRQGEPVEFGVE